MIGELLNAYPKVNKTLISTDLPILPKEATLPMPQIPVTTVRKISKPMKALRALRKPSEIKLKI